MSSFFSLHARVLNVHAIRDHAAAFFAFVGTQVEGREFNVLSFNVGERTVAVEFEIALY